MKKVAIIGGGPSGICSAKMCSIYGLEPTVFEMKSMPGGLWAPGTQIWSTMHTNMTKQSMSFSDFPWPKDESFFYPHRDQLNQYLQDYIKHFDLLKYFKLNCLVTSAVQDNDFKWKLKWKNLTSNDHLENDFDFLIVASGFFSSPNEPKVENKEKFNGLIMHSRDFRTDDERLRNKRILIVGSSNSSVEIAAELVDYAKCVINIFKRPFWLLPKFIELKSKADETKMIRVPKDFLFLTREQTYTVENKYDSYAKFLTDQIDKNKSPPDLYIDITSNFKHSFAVSEGYYNYVKMGKIETKKGQIKQFISDGVELFDGSIIKTDVVLYCTGYKLEAPYFDENILKKLSYDKNYYNNPIILYKHTFHPSFPNMAFIAASRGGFFIGMELQSKWSALIFSGKQILPSNQEMLEEIESNVIKRKSMSPSAQYPYGSYIEVIDNLAKAIGIYPLIDNADEELRKKFWKYLVLSTNFTYNENQHISLNDIEYAKHIVENGISI